MPSETDIAWLAGLLEGEGCFQLDSRWRSFNIALEMTDKDIVERAAKLFSKNSKALVRTYKRTGINKQGSDMSTWKNTYKYGWHGDNAVHLAQAILPYMGFRRASKIKSLMAKL